MLGVTVNFFAVLVGGVAGTLLRGGIPERFRTLINQGLAICVMMIGISGAITTQNTLLMIVSVVVGAFLGTLIGIEAGVERLGNWAQAKFNKGGFADGFVNATLLFSIGSMAVVGSLNAGFGDNEMLLAKSVIDGVSAIIIASSFGIGAACAAAPMTIYQGAIALLAGGARAHDRRDDPGNGRGGFGYDNRPGFQHAWTYENQGGKHAAGDVYSMYLLPHSHAAGLLEQQIL